MRKVAVAHRTRHPLGVLCFDDSVLRLTLDTSCIIHAVQSQEYGPSVDQLVVFSRGGRVGLWLTSAFRADQSLARSDRLTANLEWLSKRPAIGWVPGPFRVGYSGLGNDDVLADNVLADADREIQDIILPARYRQGHTPQSAKWRRKINDIQHLTAHRLAGHDAFVTTDLHDILRRREKLRDRVGIVAIDPEEASAMVMGVGQ
jgi:hypothetical protein